MKKVTGAFSAFLAFALLLSQAANAQALPSSTQVRGKILMVDCSRLLVEAASRDLKNECVVIYSGVWTVEGRNGTLSADSVEGNIGFAKPSTGVMDLVGKHVQMDVNLNTGKIKSVQIPD